MAGGLTVADVVRAAVRFYAMPGNSVGGRLHIVLSDGNVERANVEWCLEQAEQAGDIEAIALARQLLALSRTQRSKVYQALGRLV